MSIDHENYIAIEKSISSQSNGSSEDQIINGDAVNDARRNGIHIPPCVAGVKSVQYWSVTKILILDFVVIHADSCPFPVVQEITDAFNDMLEPYE